MADREDLGLYYVNTFLSLRGQSEKEILPAYVLGITDAKYRGDGFERFGFHLRVTSKNKDTGRYEHRDREVRYSEMDLTKFPSIGYTLLPDFSDEPMWFSYTPVRRATKGLTNHRLNLSRLPLNEGHMYEIFNPSFTGRLSDDLCVWNDRVLYKGHVAGRKLKSGYKLHPTMTHLEEAVCHYR